MMQLRRALPLLVVVLCVAAQEDSLGFRITIENLSGGSLNSSLSPLIWAVHTGVTPLFNPGQEASTGLQRLAEDGNPEVLLDELRVTVSPGGIQSFGVASYDPSQPRSAVPVGKMLHFGIRGRPGERLSFAQMLIETNDRFFGTAHDGFFLFDEQGLPRSGSVDVVLYDAGTEVNERPGAGLNQPLRQPQDNVGQNELGVVTFASDDGFDYPPNYILIRVTITAAITYRVRINNLSNGTAIPTALSPILWAVHTYPEPFFVSGMAASPGLELLAEDGVATILSQELDMKQGILFKEITSLIAAGESLEFEVPVPSGAWFSFLTMHVQTNDRFLAPFPRGINFFDNQGSISGDITSLFELWDAGTEQNQVPGAGTNQPPRSPGNTGVPEGGVVRHSAANADGYTYPSPASVFSVSVAPLTGPGFTGKSLDQRLNVNFIFSNMFKT